MKCPNCHGKTHKDFTECAHCDFTFTGYRCGLNKPSFNGQKLRQYCSRIKCCHLKQVNNAPKVYSIAPAVIKATAQLRLDGQHPA